jgi:hypothetical protein
MEPDELDNACGASTTFIVIVSVNSKICGGHTTSAILILVKNLFVEF